MHAPRCLPRASRLATERRHRSGGALLVLAGVFAGCSFEAREAAEHEPPAEVGASEEQASAAAEDTAEVRFQHTLRDQPGRWGEARALPPSELSELSEEQQAEIERLNAIGYAAGVTPAGVLRNVTRHAATRALAGLNFYISGHSPAGVLVDMAGQEVHRWEFGYFDAWPDSKVRDNPRTEFWRRAHVFENGDVLALFTGLGIVRIDRDSNLLWASELRVHHQASVLPDGTIYVLTHEPSVLPRIHEQVPVLEDFVSLLAADGRLLRSISVLECLENSEFFTRWEAQIRRGKDIFHTNALEVLDGRLAERIPAFAAGNVLLSMRRLGAIGVIDLEREAFVWMHTGDFDRQHDPRTLENGNLLLFDNNAREVGSSVQEIDPATGELRWIYRGTAADPFYTESCGAARRLANGNTLIVETDNGRAFEVTPENEIVWEFLNPHRAGDDAQFVASLFDVLRLPPDFGAGWIGHD